MTEAGPILARLEEITRLLEENRASVFNLEVERFELLARLRGMDWKPPDPRAGHTRPVESP